MRSLSTTRLPAKFLLWLVPSFLFVSSAGLYLVEEINLSFAVSNISTRVGNHAGRVAAALARNDFRSHPELGADLMSSLLADRAVRCAALQVENERGSAITVPSGQACIPRPDVDRLEIPVDDPVDVKLEVELDFSEVVQAQRNERNDFLLVLAFGLCVACGASLLAFRQTVNVPLLRLLNSIRHTARTGQFEPVQNASRDELGIVIDNYNAMQKRLLKEGALERASHAHIDRLYNATPAPMFCVDSQGSVIEASQYWLSFVGYQRREVVGKPLADFMVTVGDNSDLWADVLQKAYLPRQPDREVEVLHRSGRRITSLLAVSIMDESISGHLCVVTDISHLRKAEDALRKAAITDQLTGLPNRAAIPELTGAIIKKLAPEDRFAVIYIDLDDFKKVNDTFGHEGGDRLLIEAVARMKRVIRRDSTLFRLGGDEFAVAIGDNPHRREAEHIARRICDEMSRPVDLGAGAGFVAASIGIAYQAADEANWAEALHLADIAMYNSKTLGKGCVTVYSPEIAKPLPTPILHSRPAPFNGDTGRLSLALQPIVRLRDRRPLGAEALFRLQQASLMSRPARATDERVDATGQIERISLWAIGKILAQAGNLEKFAAPDAFISLNVSANHLNAASLAHLRRGFEETDFPATRLVVEISERALLRDFDRASQIIDGIRALGARVALDDFSSAPSSWRLLARLPFDILKLDRALIAGFEEAIFSVAEPQKAAAQVRSIAARASELGVAVVAQGVETEGNASELAQLGVEFAQGGFISQPMPEVEFWDWLPRHERSRLEPRRSQAPERRTPRLDVVHSR